MISEIDTLYGSLFEMPDIENFKRDIIEQIKAKGYRPERISDLIKAITFDEPIYNTLFSIEEGQWLSQSRLIIWFSPEEYHYLLFIYDEILKTIERAYRLFQACKWSY